MGEQNTTIARKMAVSFIGILLKSLIVGRTG
jgi:hypothetical protein